MTKIPMAKHNTTNTGAVMGLGGFLGGLGNLIETLADMAEKAEHLKKEGGVEGENIKIVSGFTVRTGLGREGESDIRIEPFGNVRKDRTGHAVVHDVREPLVDVFDEADHVLVVAELPGVAAEDVRLSLADDLLTVEAARDDKKYHKEIHLPQSMDPARMTHHCHHGVLEVRLGKS